ncbi:MAG: hypothetical protein FWG11_01180 [Promicromonosporaceae bacterium]|nr:hypothetical protein [Promicromonosporaceae bacterium]
MSAIMAAPAIHRWVDRLDAAQAAELRDWVATKATMPPIDEDASDITETPEFAAWVQAEVAPVMARIAAGEATGYSGDEVLEWLAAKQAKAA